jgi:hypothetical protein
LPIVNGGTTGTDVPLTDIIEQNAGWTLSGTGTLIVPATGRYLASYTVTILYSAVNIATVVSAVVKRNGTPLQGTQLTVQQSTAAARQVVGMSWIQDLSTNDDLIISTICNAGSPFITAGPGLFPSSNIQTAASLTLNRIA